MGLVQRRAFMAAFAATVIVPNLAHAQTPTAHNMAWGTLSHAGRDAAYNNSAAVSDSAQIVDRWVAASATFRSQRPKYLDLAYGPGERNKWDLFPADNPTAPCLVFIHGGYWQSRNREHFSCFAEGVLARGWSAALPGYTLAPAANLTQIVNEVRSALDWLAAQGRWHRGTCDYIGLVSRRASHCAIVGPSQCTGGLAISGIFELGPIRDTYLNERLKLTDEEIATLSPLRLPGVSKPLAITYGTAELTALVRNSRVYHAHRAQSHQPGSLIPIPNANHYTGMEELRSPNGILTRSAVRLIEDLS